ncbi:WD-40 repeat protein [[Actinomadura] parvosata subsp. kistnae]|nr:WD-40 repeat protein [Actinomadura parvosata subsp. kistnae]
MLRDPRTPADLAAAVAELARVTRGVALLYYAGHGLLGPDGELYLATQASADLTRGSAVYQALPFAQVRELLRTAAIQHSVVVLDCCWAGRAHGWSDSYLLTATSRTEVAWALPGERHTAFTGALLRVLYDGDETGPAWLSLDDVHLAVGRLLRQRALPAPRRQASDASGRRPLLPNHAYVRPPNRPAPGLADDGRRSPYPGLHPFGVHDAEFFFGRQQLTRALRARVHRDRAGLVVVTGASGTGKSSLLQAGLTPALGAARCVLMTPGANPLARLAEALAEATGVASPVPSAQPGVRELTATVRRLPPGAVLVVDQFEETFTHGDSARPPAAFVAALAAVAEEITVVVGLRADFFGHCAAHPVLLTALEHPLVVGPLDADRLREVIEGPARPGRAGAG